MKQIFDLDQPLLEFSSQSGTTQWTIRDAVEGTQIFGGIGSGKTSGSGEKIAMKFLNAGFGGLVLTAKESEKKLWIEYCNRAGKKKNLIIIEPGGKHIFNFLSYISHCAPGQLPLTENIVHILKTVIDAGQEKESGMSDDPFWDNALDLLLSNAIELCVLAHNKVSIAYLLEIVSSAPKSETNDMQERTDRFSYHYTQAADNIRKAVKMYRENASRDHLRALEDEAFQEEIYSLNIPGYSALKRIDTFFAETYQNLSDKTRSIIDFCFTSFLSRLVKDPVYSLFCKGDSTVIPEDSLRGKIILINLPVKTFQKVGRDVQVMFKYIWQLAMEKRNIQKNERPVFLWADEAQHFLHKHDAEYQATARSSRVATVYISQNLPNYHANMGGAKSKYRVQSFLGTLGTKIFHANADIETNKYASELIGEGYTKETSRSSSVSGKFSSSRSEQYRLYRMVRPEEFAGLKTGGPLNDYIVEGYIHLQSKTFPNGFNFKKVRFKQNIHQQITLL